MYSDLWRFCVDLGNLDVSLGNLIYVVFSTCDTYVKDIVNQNYIDQSIKLYSDLWSFDVGLCSLDGCLGIFIWVVWTFNLQQSFVNQKYISL